MVSDSTPVGLNLRDARIGELEKDNAELRRQLKEVFALDQLNLAVTSRQLTENSRLRDQLADTRAYENKVIPGMIDELALAANIRRALEQSIESLSNKEKFWHDEFDRIGAAVVNVSKKLTERETRCRELESSLTELLTHLQRDYARYDGTCGCMLCESLRPMVQAYHHASSLLSTEGEVLAKRKREQSRSALLEKFYATWNLAESNRGVYSCTPEHDARCERQMMSGSVCVCYRAELDWLDTELNDAKPEVT